MAADRPGENAQQGIKSIEVGARVLLALERGRGPLTLTEVAKASDLHPAKVHRYLTSLVRTGLASQDATTGMYDLGPAARHLGVEALRRVDSVRTALTRVVDLRDATGHTVNVSVWSDLGPTMVSWDTGAHLLPTVIRVGSTLPLLDSAVGYVFLAYLPAAMTADALRAQQEQGATRTLPAAEVEKLKEEIRRDGYGSTRNQMIFGLAALSAPVFGADGQIELAIGVILPARMMTERESKKLATQIRANAEAISRELGFSG
ncbi:MAG: IclR family transcriptional regulator [Solirubrobacterales bacterium]